MPRPPNPEVRTRLLAQGGQLVYGRGFSATGVQDIAAAAGVPKGSFYSYFASKEAFGAAVLDEYWNSIESRHGPVFSDTRLKPLKRIEKFFKLLSQDHAAHDFKLGCLIGNLSLELSNTSSDVRNTLMRVLGEWEASLTTCLEEAQGAGDLAADRAASQIAAVIVESWEGAILRCKVEQSKKACDRFLGVTLKQLLQ